MGKVALGRADEAVRPDFVKAALAEIVCTFLFVFAGVGSCMAVKTLGGSEALSLAIVALTHAFAVYGMVSAGFNISGGHLNPAVTLGLAVGGHITIFKSIVYCISQLLGSALACVVLKFVTGGLDTPIHSLGKGVDSLEGVVMEIVLTFSLLFTVYATAVDPKKGNLGVTAPLTVGLIVGANIIAGGAYSGASMNPARSFGPALVSWDWTDHWIYWVGPLIGGGLAGLVYEIVFTSESSYVPVSPDYAP